MKFEKIKSFFKTRAAKSIIVASSALLIGLAIYLNYQWFYGAGDDIGYGDNNMVDNNDPAGDGTVNVSTYFSATQLSRQEARDEALEVLQNVVENEDAAEATKQEAMAEISKIALDIQNEANVESLVKAKGFENCVAVISGDKINVIVASAEELVASQVVQINEIVYEATGILPVNVKIMRK